MSILAMRHLRVIAAKEERETLLKDLSRLGCLEIKEASGELREELSRFSEAQVAEVRSRLQELVNAIAVVRDHTKIKRGMFAVKPTVSDTQMLDVAAVEKTEQLAVHINELARTLQSSYAEEGRLQNRKEALLPWRDLDVALSTESGKYHIAQFGVVPAVHPYEETERAVLTAAPDTMLYRASTDAEQHYLFFICHRDDFDAVMEALRQFGFGKTQFKDASGTAADEIYGIESQIAEARERRAALVSEICGFAEALAELELAHDVLKTKLEQETAQEQMLETATTFLLEGWIPLPSEGKVIKCLERHGCAYDLRDPFDEEEPPILTKNPWWAAPFGMITDMYSPPAYRGFDPNPFMAVYFSLFFGLMFSDAGYGLLMLIAVGFAKWKLKPKGTMGKVVTIAFFCGITTFIWGALFGGWFGNAIPAVYEMITGNVYSKSMALWFDPLNDPMKMLIFSFILGAVHIFSGMGIKAYMLIREGKIWDAVFDIGFWWVFLIGIVLALVGLPGGMYVLIAGALGLILTQGRAKPKLLGKFFSGVMSLYDVTGFLGDILSYSRLLALSMSTAVIAQVVNTMGAMTGPIGFFFIFLIGQIFNIAVSLIGTFVHTSRLQYVEFFGKFYEAGGENFAPLTIQSKYVDIIKEEQ